jgi:hypothetical protein
MFSAVAALVLLPLNVYGKSVSSYSIKELYALAADNSGVTAAVSGDPDPSLLNFYGNEL